MSTRRGLLTLATLTAFGIASVVALGRTRGADDALQVLRETDPRWLVGCAALELLSLLAYARALRAFVEVDRSLAIGVSEARRLMFASLGGARLVAVGGAGGLAVMYWGFRQLGSDRQVALARVLGLNILVFGIFGLIGWAAAVARLVVPPIGTGVPLVLAIAWSLAIPACVAAALRLRNLGDATRIPSEHPTRREQGVLAVSGGLKMVRDIALRARHHRRMLLAGATYWLADIGCLALSILAVGAGIGPVEICLAYVTGYVAMLAPLPTGGFGAVEAAVTASLTVVGVSISVALASVAIWRAFNFWLPTVPALVALARLPKLGRDLRAESSS